MNAPPASPPRVAGPTGAGRGAAAAAASADVLARSVAILGAGHVATEANAIPETGGGASDVLAAAMADAAAALAGWREGLLGSAVLAATDGAVATARGAAIDYASQGASTTLRLFFEWALG